MVWWVMVNLVRLEGKTEGGKKNDVPFDVVAFLS